MARWPVVLLVLCLWSAMAAGAVGPVAAETDSAGGFTLAQEFDRAQFRITVFANDSARWTFHYERTLANETERRQFEAFAEDFNSNDSGLYSDFRNQSRALVEQAESTTGRAMVARRFSRDAFVSAQLNEVGVVEMAFTWSGFARTEAETVVVGDVFEGGLYVGPDQALVVRAADGLVFQSVDPAGTLSGGSLATSDTVTWSGERTFTDNRPRVVLGAADDDQVATNTTEIKDGPSTGTTATMGTTVGTEVAAPVWPLAIVAAVIALLLGLFLYRRRGSPSSRPTEGGTGTASPTTVDETELLDDETRIEGILENRGGRMRQSELVEATGWSKSKVSMVLSEMEQADEIRKLRVGRENIVSLPGHEPDAAGSPHDDGG